MRKIYKYVLDLRDPNSWTIEVPVGAVFIAARNVGGELCVYADCPNVSSPTLMDSRELLVVGTGHTIPDKSLAFIDTAVMDKGLLVWQVYEVLNDRKRLTR